MKKTLVHIPAALLLASAFAPAPAAAVPLAVPSAPDAPLVQVAGDCRAIGQQMAAREGGMLTSATAQSQGGRTVCHIVIVVPPKDGQRGRRIELSVPL